MGSLQPGYKPSLVLIFASLGDIHAERYHKTKRKADLDEAIWATRLALSISSADHPLTTTLLNNLGNGLWRRYRSASQEDDLHQALYYSLQAVDSLSWEDSNLADVLGTLGAIRASLYDCRGDFQDLQEAISITRRSIDIATQCARTAPVIIFNNLGVYLWTQYRLTDHREDLDDSISTLVKAVKFPTENTIERVTCLINSGYVLTQRYHRTGQLQDLSCALEHAQEAVRLDPKNGDLTTLLKFLDRFIDQHREPISSVHCSESRWNLNRFSGKILMALFVLILIATIYAYHPRVELLLSIVAFPSGIIYHWLVSRRPNTEPRISKQYHFMPILSLREHIGTLGKSKEFTPKVLEVPLIPVPSASSLRGIQTSNFSAYTSALYHQRRQSIHPVKTGLVGESRFLTDRHRAKEEKVHKTKYRGHRLMSLPRLSHDEIPTISAKTPGVSGKCESPKNSVPSVLQIARLPAEVQLSRNEMGSAYRQPETHVNDSSMQRYLGTDFVNGSFSATKHDAGTLDSTVEYGSEDHNDISSDEQDHQSNTSPSSYSHFATSRDNASAEHVPSPLAPSQKLWAKPGSEYSEHKIWEEQESPSQNGEKEQVRVVYQGHTDLKMDTNSGLAMGNVTSTTAKVVGYINSKEPKSRRQHSDPEQMSRTSRLEDAQSEITLQEEEVQIVPVLKVADFEDSISADASVDKVEVQAQAPFTSTVENLVDREVSRVVELEDNDSVIIEQENSFEDLVEQLAREYLESPTL